MTHLVVCLDQNPLLPSLRKKMRLKPLDQGPGSSDRNAAHLEYLGQPVPIFQPVFFG